MKGANQPLKAGHRELDLRSEMLGSYDRTGTWQSPGVLNTSAPSLEHHLTLISRRPGAR